MRRCCYVVVLSVGCGFQGHGTTDAGGLPGSDSGSDGSSPTIDASTTTDAASDVGPINMCFGTGLVTVCLTTLPNQPLTLPAGTFDTSVDTNCTQLVTQNGGPTLCVVAATTITGATTFVATGTRPLVLLGTTGITIPGTVDVSSTATVRGAGANSALCSVPTSGSTDSGGGGGGAGGSFGTKGGDGGLGDGNNNHLPNGTAPPGLAGAAAPLPAVLHGGCPGGLGGGGGADPSGPKGGVGGDGGGAIYLIAGQTIQIAGAVYASGAGGIAHAGTTGYEEGGGGGGAGGMIGIDAPTINIPGKVAANGGAGAGGGGNVGGTSGAAGTTTSYNTVATHGIGDATGNAANGGDGSSLGHETPGVGAGADAGGGGGGGGVGVVWIDGTLQNGQMISPAKTPH